MPSRRSIVSFVISLFLIVSFSNSANAQFKQDQELADLIKRLADRSTDGLSVETTADGGMMMDLKGRFQNVMIGQIGSGGTPLAACVTSLREANLFFQRDLETGQPLINNDFRPDPLAKVAAMHGMNVPEFKFYRDLAEQYSGGLAPSSSNIVIVINDGTGEGFNDTASFTPEGGNPGTTLGAARLNLFNEAAGIWEAFLDSSVAINVRSQFDPLAPCSTSGGVLGSAGAVSIHANFVNSEFSNTWYHAALANKQRGLDISAGSPSINATFNSDVDNGCLGPGTRFYYGFDNSTPPSRINLLIVLLHEMGHGLGFSSFVNGSTGALQGDLPDVYTTFMYDRSTAKFWNAMSDAERQASALNTNNVLWDGANVKIASGFLSAGRDVANGRVELFTPNPLQGGSSISHFNTAASPDLLMEPAINIGLPLTLDLTRQQMRDIGWYRDTTNDLVPDTITGVAPSGGTVIVGNNVNITWTNNGGFNRNVTIELSTDGGATYPTAIATNTANTGTFSWTVPNNLTTQGRVRVREHNFVAPLGASADTFNISGPSAASVTLSGRVLDSNGYGIPRAAVYLTGTAGEVFSASTNFFGYYRITGIPAGSSYVLHSQAKEFEFTPQVIQINDNTEVNMIAGR